MCHNFSTVIYSFPKLKHYNPVKLTVYSRHKITLDHIFVAKMGTCCIVHYTVVSHRFTIPYHRVLILSHQLTIPYHCILILSHQFTIPYHCILILSHRSTIPYHRISILSHRFTIPYHCILILS